MTYPVQKSDAEWQAILKDKGAEPVALQVTRHAATERPFTGKYEAHWADGSYHCICCGAKLFDSVTKFDAGCGWPSFAEAIPGAITASRKVPVKAGGVRQAESTCSVRSKFAIVPVRSRKPNS